MSNKNNKIIMQNISRWSEASSFSTHWSSRSQLICDLIPEKSSVIEFGIGLNSSFSYLKSKNVTKYTATDFIKRDNAIIYDLNKISLDDFEKHDVAIFSGVLEYINNIPYKIKFISTRVNMIITSYSTYEKYPNDRELRGWINSYTDSDFEKIFESVNYKIINKVNWKNQTIYAFATKNN